MNAAEFARLKAGDKIENAMSGSFGEVVDRTDSGISVKWAHTRAGLGKEPARDNAASVRHYPFQSTIWMHWSLAEPEVGPELDKAITDELEHPPASIMKGA